MISFELLRDEGILVVKPQDAIEAADFDRLARTVDPYIAEHDTLAGLLIEAPSFPGWDSFAAMIEHLKFVRDHHRKIRCVAAVTDSSFLKVAPRIAAHFAQPEIKGSAAPRGSAPSLARGRQSVDVQDRLRDHICGASGCLRQLHVLVCGLMAEGGNKRANDVAGHRRMSRGRPGGGAAPLPPIAPALLRLAPQAQCCHRSVTTTVEPRRRPHCSTTACRVEATGAHRHPADLHWLARHHTLAARKGALQRRRFWHRTTDEHGSLIRHRGNQWAVA